MKKRLHTAILLSLLTFSVLFMMPTVVNAVDYEDPDLGDINRIEFFDFVLESVVENGTRIDLMGSLLFDNKVAYLTVNTSSNITETDIYDEFYGLVDTNLTDESGNDIYLATNASMMINRIDFTQDTYVHIMLWDHDKSLINFLLALNNAVQTNDSLKFLGLLLQLVTDCETVLDGDEVFIISPVFFWNFFFNITYQIDNQYIIDANGNGPFDEIQNGSTNDFNDLSSSVKGNITEAADEHPGLYLLMNDSAGTQTGEFSHFFFLIQQIWLKQLFFDLN